MPKDKRSFFERLTGSFNVDAEDMEEEFDMEESYDPPARDAQAGEEPRRQQVHHQPPHTPHEQAWEEDSQEEGQLMVDLYQTGDEIVIQSMIAGVSPKDVEVNITRDMVTISGTREAPSGIRNEDYFYQELYWGPFSRTILLPQEVDPDGAEAVERNGLLTLKLPRVDKDRRQQIKVKSV